MKSSIDPFPCETRINNENKINQEIALRAYRQIKKYLFKKTYKNSVKAVSVYGTLSVTSYLSYSSLA
jgi:hypothetical protein